MDLLGTGKLAIVIALFISALGREVLRGSALLGVCDLVSVFGGLAWLVTAVGQVSGDSDAYPPRSASDGPRADSEKPADTGTVLDSSAPQEVKADASPQPAKASLSESALSIVGVALAGLALITIFYEGLIIAPILLSPFIAVYFGGRRVFSAKSRLSPAVRTVAYLAASTLMGLAWSRGFRDISGKTVYLVGYAIEVIVCLLSYASRLCGQTDNSQADHE